MQTPAYHMRMMDLVSAQKAERSFFSKKHSEALVALRQKHLHDRMALRQKHRDTRAREKAEKAFIAESRKEADFWTYYPNHDGRRDTMTAVLQSLELCTEHVSWLMPIYATWLLTAKKTDEKGPMSRWALMTAFATER
jgi:predicted phosphoadenosine phosphosulfate sulfurtransferase